MLPTLNIGKATDKIESLNPVKRGQPHPQGLVVVENGGMYNTLANNTSQDHKIRQLRAQIKSTNQNLQYFWTGDLLFARVFSTPF